MHCDRCWLGVTGSSCNLCFCHLQQFWYLVQVIPCSRVSAVFNGQLGISLEVLTDAESGLTDSRYGATSAFLSSEPLRVAAPDSAYMNRESSALGVTHSIVSSTTKSCADKIHRYRVGKVVRVC